MSRAKKHSEPDDEQARRTARQPPPARGRDIGPHREPPRAAVEAATAIITTQGVTNAIRALDLALREHAPTVTASAAADVAELARLTGLRRRATP